MLSRRKFLAALAGGFAAAVASPALALPEPENLALQKKQPKFWTNQYDQPMLPLIVALPGETWGWRYRLDYCCWTLALTTGSYGEKLCVATIVPDYVVADPDKGALEVVVTEMRRSMNDAIFRKGNGFALAI